MADPASFRATPSSLDPEMIRTFSEVVFGYVEGPVAVRILTEKGRPDGQPWTDIHDADEHLAENLERAAARAARAGRALFVVPATLKQPGRACAENIAETGVLVVDLDEGDIEVKRRRLVDALGPPTLTVASGGVTDAGARKLHLYWRLTEAASGDDLQRVAALRETLALKSGGDISFKRITQPIRVPGSLHCKADPPRLVEILERTDFEIDLAEAEQRAAEMNSPDGHAGDRTGPRSVASLVPASRLRQMRVRSEGRDGITRFDALSRLIGHWVRLARLGDVSLDEAWAAVRDHNQTLIDPPWEEARLTREFEALLRRDRKANSEEWSKGAEKPASNAPDSDDALATTFVDLHGDDLRYMPASRAWYCWTGEVWRRDTTGRVEDLVRDVCRAAAARCTSASAARKIASAKTMQAVERIARSDQRITIEPSDLDADPMRLNVLGAAINLETGEIETAKRDLLMSRIAGSRPGGPRTRWLAFIEEITDGDDDLAGYLQRVAGYCLTGSTEEQAFFFLHGAGANGKSVFLDTIAAAMGDYARTAPFETFAASRHASHPTDLAGLQGARLVLVTETDRDRDWAESRIKAVTGGDMISARFMRGDFFEYRPSFKLVVSGNHRPGLNSYGEAMRRRLHMIPFEVTIPPERRDPKLSLKLRAELGGILEWMIEGCAAWRKHGLDAPERVRVAADEYFQDEDLVGQWIAERCRVGDGMFATSRDLFASWKAFCEAGGHQAGSSKQLAGDLRARAFTAERNNRVRGWRGIGLLRAGEDS